MSHDNLLQKVVTPVTYLTSGEGFYSCSNDLDGPEDMEDLESDQEGQEAVERGIVSDLFWSHEDNRWYNPSKM